MSLKVDAFKVYSESYAEWLCSRDRKSAAIEKLRDQMHEVMTPYLEEIEYIQTQKDKTEVMMFAMARAAEAENKEAWHSFLQLHKEEKKRRLRLQLSDTPSAEVYAYDEETQP